MSLRFTTAFASFMIAGCFAASAHAATNSAGKSKDSAASATALYTVKEDGTKVDDGTLAGWKTWRALSCARCHGAQQEGLVGPSLIEALKTMTRDEFKAIMEHGRIPQGMPAFGTVPRVMDNIDNLYAYLKGRSEGNIDPGNLKAID